MSTTAAPAGEKKSGDEEIWTYDLFGCLGDWRLCVATFVCPCYTLAKNASFLGDDGMVVGLLYIFGFFAFEPVTRWRIRQLKNIRGTMVSDVVLGMLCPCCTLIQENKELFGMRGSHFGEQVPLNVEIQRNWACLRYTAFISSAQWNSSELSFNFNCYSIVMLLFNTSYAKLYHYFKSTLFCLISDFQHCTSYHIWSIVILPYAR